MICWVAVICLYNTLPFLIYRSDGAGMASGVANFIRRNLFIVLAVPPVLAAITGMYARMIRDQRPLTSRDKGSSSNAEDGELLKE